MLDNRLKNYHLYQKEMPQLFIDHPGGNEYYSCLDCKAPFANTSDLVSKDFQGTSGKAFLFKRVVNIDYGMDEKKQMTTGVHLVRDAICRCCKLKIGWYYIYAYEDTQQYKEGI